MPGDIEKRLLVAVKNAARVRGLTNERLQEIVLAGGFEALFHPRATVSRASILLALGVVDEDFNFVMNYGLNLRELALAARLLSSFNNEMSKLGSYEVEIPEHDMEGAVQLSGEIYAYPKVGGMEEADRIIEGTGRRHATLYEGLAFASAFPSCQTELGRSFGILTFGTPLTVRYSDLHKQEDEETGYFALAARDISVAYGRFEWQKIATICRESRLSTHHYFLAVREVTR